jgi:hypothetical protein
MGLEGTDRVLFMVLRQHLGAVTEVNHEHTESRKPVRRLTFEPGTEVAERCVTNTALFKVQ